MKYVSVGAQGHGTVPNPLDGLGVISLLMMGHPKQMQGVDVFLLDGQDSLIQRHRCIQLTGAVHFDGRCQNALHDYHQLK